MMEKMEEGRRFKGCVCSCAHVLTGSFVWEPDLALELLSNLGQLGVGGSDVLQTLVEVGGEGRGEGRGGEEQGRLP